MLVELRFWKIAFQAIVFLSFVVKLIWSGSSSFLLSFFETLGHVFNRPTTEDMNEAYEMAENMPVYPIEGSIKESDNLIVIKIGETKID